ncbi:AmpG family muropeptide MFS transporter [Photobacterium iliopiscarium]|uniref:AmpG family muropeptide MFS transporter n=1 Tax=Photobacterium iliopiscarium TaxID=56192 RepID=UPI001E64F93B|nr:MFS transporter [Photobacterium iliopiscarium]MCD9468409.1 AmpG family muropeptide MFS transporter [Photobacterium iliopiscarium]MCD9488371.1 MFS transporter [Photobacterium iliopiscarium]MCF2245134.1 MFS transporter [Photobacterium iliopiscarium]
MDKATPIETPKGWRIYANPKALIMLALGFSSGLPILLVFGTLSFWLREADVSKTSIGFFSWVALAYGFKWAWSPLVDRFPLPIFSRLFGRRRGWMLFSQLIIILSLCGMALSNPQTDLFQFAIFAIMVAFASATQDIVIDAFRIELATERMQAALSATYLAGYRLAMIMAGAGTLAFAAWFGSNTGYDPSGWKSAYFMMAAMMLIGVITTFIVKEPTIDNSAINKIETDYKLQLIDKGYNKHHANLSAWFYTAVIMPFRDFFQRYGKNALLILLLISCYRISDIVMGVMANVFYVDMGFTKNEVASVSKIFGVAMTLVGAGLGGILVNKFGTLKILALGALLSAITNLLFIMFSYVGNNLEMLTVVISADNFGAGIATAAFITFMSSLTNVAFSATQYALFSSIMVLFPKFLAGFSGIYIDHFGYNVFFLTTALMGVPVLILIRILANNSALNIITKPTESS